MEGCGFEGWVWWGMMGVVVEGLNLSFIFMNINLSPCFLFSIPVGIFFSLRASHCREIL